MRRKALQLTLMLAAGWLGGLSSHWLFPMRFADAKDRILQTDQIWVYGPDGKHRLQMGTYPGSGERGLPLVGLNDNEGRLRLLLRLAGDKGSPVMIFKDKNGSDRMVLGLNYSGGDEAPFITCLDENGVSRSLVK